MKFSLSKEAALAAISPVVGVIPESHPIPILTNIVIEALSSGTVMFRGRSDALEAISITEAEVEEAGSTTVTADTLGDVIRKARPGSITFKQADPESRVEVRAGSSLFRLAPLPVGDMPALKEADYRCTISMTGSVLGDCLSKARVAIARGKSAQANVFGGVRIAARGNELHFVAMNGHQYVLVRQDRPEGWPDDLAATISPDALEQFCSLASAGGDEEVRLAVCADRVSLSAGMVMVSAPTLNGTGFPDYLDMADKYSSPINVRMKVQRAELIESIRRIVSVGNVWTKTDKAVKIECEADHITITAKSHVGDSMERIEVEDGAPVTLGFNPDFILPVLDQIDGEILTMGLTSIGDRKTGGAVLLQGENEDVTAFVGQRMV